MRLCLSFWLGCLLLAPSAFAQDNTDLFELSLEELMNVEITSASQKQETVFDAPVTSYSITRDEITKAGINSIPEALRLCPGIIVRETSPGNYDVHIRGFDNLARYAESRFQGNLTTLVMIDSRPVFNYNLGGTVWESLPIDLIDVERIEVVQGPAGPLFGPNAVTGVINIITREYEGDEFHTSAAIRYGTPQFLLGNVAVSKQVTSRLRATISANYQRRERFQEEYYLFGSDMFVEDINVIPNASEAYADPKQALQRTGINSQIDYQYNDSIRLSASVGWQQSEAQRPYMTFNSTSLTTSTTQGQHLALTGNIFRFKTQLSHRWGTDNMYVGSFLIDNQYDFGITEINVDYEAHLSSKVTLKPRVSFHHHAYDGSAYEPVSERPVLIKGKVANQSIAGSLQGDYRPSDQLRLLAAVRVDQFDLPDQHVWSYQFASVYKPTTSLVLRAAHARSVSSAFVGPYQINVENLPLPNALSSYFGNANLPLTQNIMSEVGVRMQATDRLQLEVSLFRQRLTNLSNLLLVGQQVQEETVSNTFQYTSLPMKGVQHGITLSANWMPSQGLQIKPFATFQRTSVRDLHSGITADFSALTDEQHKGTPAWYGGVFVNWHANRRINANVNAYFMASQHQYHYMDLIRPSDQGLIKSKVLINPTLTYRLVERLKIVASVRNALGQDHKEYYGTDRIGRSFYVGASYNF